MFIKDKSIYVMFNLNVYIYKVMNTFDDLQNVYILSIQHFMYLKTFCY